MELTAQISNVGATVDAYRIQRDISHALVIPGVEHGNLRELRFCKRCIEQICLVSIFDP
jgi:histone acetyltransferase (RNA polymerase elongator complex component)